MDEKTDRIRLAAQVQNEIHIRPAHSTSPAFLRFRLCPRSNPLATRDAAMVFPLRIENQGCHATTWKIVSYQHDILDEHVRPPAYLHSHLRPLSDWTTAGACD